MQAYQHERNRNHKKQKDYQVLNHRLITVFF
jgi:hypothetical protein